MRALMSADNETKAPETDSAEDAEKAPLEPPAAGTTEKATPLPSVNPAYADEGGVVAAFIAATVAEIAEMDAELDHIRNHGKVSPKMLEVAGRELTLAIGVTRVAILNADKQLEVDATSPSSLPTVEARKVLLAKLNAQVALVARWGLMHDDAADGAVLDAALIKDASTNSSSFAESVPFYADEGVDQRLVYGYLALRESKSEKAAAALAAGAGSAEDAATAQMNELLPSFNANRGKESASLLAAISTDADAYDSVLAKHAGAASPGVMDRLRDVAACEPQMAFWEYRVNHPWDPPLDALEYVLVRRRRAADESILLCQIVCDILVSLEMCPATVVPGGVKPVKRFLFKSVFKYILKGCFSRCYDAVRLTISVLQLDDAAVVAEAIKANPKLLMLREKLRLDPDSNTAASGGYRDMQFLVAGERSASVIGGPRHYVGEITVNLADNIKIKQGDDAGNGLAGQAAFTQASETGSFLPATDSFTGAASEALAAKIQSGTLHDVTIVHESTGVSVPVQALINAEEEGAPPLPEDAAVAAALSSALASEGCNVQTLNLSKHPRLQTLVVPKLTGIGTLTRLTLSNFHGKTFPDTLGDMVQLEHLDISGCSELLTIPSTVGQLKKLTVLNLEACWHLKTLPAEVGDLVSLKILDMNGCGKLKMLPDSIGNLAELIELKLERVSKLLALPSTVGKCSKLELLTISGKMTELPAEIGELNRLKTFELTYCNDLSAIPPTIKGCANLTSLLLHGGFASIPAEIGDLKLLKWLTICCFAEQLPAEIGQLKQLTLLNIANSYELKALPESVSSLTSLKKLDVRGCTQLDFQALPPLGAGVEVVQDAKKKKLRGSKRGSSKRGSKRGSSKRGSKKSTVSGNEEGSAKKEEGAAKTST